MEIIFALILGIAPMEQSFKCGIKPIVPLTCRDLVCICDRDGKNCDWMCEAR